MAPRSKVSRQKIIDAAFKIVSEHGWAKLSARSVANALKSSTMPIYSHFETMAEIEEEVVRRGMALRVEYESQTYTGIQSLDYGIAYVLFAWEEPKLFEALFDRKHMKLQHKYGDPIFDKHVDDLSRNPRMRGLSNEQLRYFQFLAWIFVHGVASIKDWANEREGKVQKEALIKLIRDGARALTHGFLQTTPRAHEKEEKVPKKLSMIVKTEYKTTRRKSQS